MGKVQRKHKGNVELVLSLLLRQVPPVRPQLSWPTMTRPTKKVAPKPVSRETTTKIIFESQWEGNKKHFISKEELVCLLHSHCLPPRMEKLTPNLWAWSLNTRRFSYCCQIDHRHHSSVTTQWKIKTKENLPFQACYGILFLSQTHYWAIKGWCNFKTEKKTEL